MHGHTAVWFPPRTSRETPGKMEVAQQGVRCWLPGDSVRSRAACWRSRTLVACVQPRLWPDGAARATISVAMCSSGTLCCFILPAISPFGHVGRPPNFCCRIFLYTADQARRPHNTQLPVTCFDRRDTSNQRPLASRLQPRLSAARRHGVAGSTPSARAVTAAQHGAGRCIEGPPRASRRACRMRLTARAAACAQEQQGMAGLRLQVGALVAVEPALLQNTCPAAAVSNR